MEPEIIPLTEEDLHELYLWVDSIPLSRPKRNIARDFSDGVCVAEAVKHFFPKLVELHNYQGAHSLQGKVANWDTLNTRVFRKLFFEVPAEEIRDITAAVPGAIERFLRALRIKIEQIQLRQQQQQRGGGAGGGASPQSQQRPQSSSSSGQQQQYRQQQSGGSAQQQQQQQPPRGPSPQRASSATSASSGGGGGMGGMGGGASSSHHALQQEVFELRAILREKDHTIQQLQEAVALLTEKTAQLEELVNTKDAEVRILVKQASANEYYQQQQQQQHGGGGGGRHGGGGGGSTSARSASNGWRR